MRFSGLIPSTAALRKMDNLARSKQRANGPAIVSVYRGMMLFQNTLGGGYARRRTFGSGLCSG